MKKPSRQQALKAFGQTEPTKAAPRAQTRTGVEWNMHAAIAVAGPIKQDDFFGAACALVEYLTPGERRDLLAALRAMSRARADREVDPEELRRAAEELAALRGAGGLLN